MIRLSKALLTLATLMAVVCACTFVDGTIHRSIATSMEEPTGSTGIPQTGENASDPLTARSPGVKAATPDLRTAIIQVAKQNIPAVVHIQVTDRQEIENPLLPFENDPFFRRYFHLPRKMPKKFERQLIGVGTGMIVDAEGHILTNNHVVEGATKIEVSLSDGHQFPGKVIGTDPKTDLGVIKIDSPTPLPYVYFGDSDAVEVGEWVVAIGQPRNLTQSVSQGIISALHRTGITDPSSYQDFLQTDAAINPGNSGGPLLDLNGLVVGVNSAILSESGGFEGIGFAIPSNMAIRIANQLLTNGHVERGWIGVTIQDLDQTKAQALDLKTTEGALITDVLKDGPADLAGIKPGDVILKYRGKTVPDSSFLRNSVADTAIGQTADVVFWRDGESRSAKIVIGNIEEADKRLAKAIWDHLGARIRPVTEQEAQQYDMPSPQGVVIVSVNRSGPLGKAGFEVGDIILALNGETVQDASDFAGLVFEPHKTQKVTLLVLDHRSGRVGEVEVRVP